MESKRRRNRGGTIPTVNKAATANNAAKNDIGLENSDWRYFPKWHDEYEKGLDKYLEFLFATGARGKEIACPCRSCDYRYWFDTEKVKGHVMRDGLSGRAERHLEKPIDLGQGEESERHNEDIGSDIDEICELINDFREGEGLDEEAKKFSKLVEDGQQELYPGCKNFSRLSFTIRLFLYKSDHKLSNAAFGDLLDLLRALIPDAKLPSSFYEAKNIIKVLGLDYTKIDACPNDCMLYWEEHAEATSCHVCDSPRWKVAESDEVLRNTHGTIDADNDDAPSKPHQIPLKILRYFPIKKRLQRLFMCRETAEYMMWHAKRKRKEGLMEHISDGKSWIDFDKKHSEFAKDPRNVRLGLATDGFSPFNNMGIVYSTWPVVLLNYNLPPWLCIKPEFFMLALLIPGPSSPGNDIDIYLQPLIKDLKELWDSGLDTYDVVTGKRFNLHAALISTINDFPAYAMVSGWSTKGKKACPCCHYETCHYPLKFSSKVVYMDHRRFLDLNHPSRFDLDFNGKLEERMEPKRLTGADIMELLSDFQNLFGKKTKKRVDPEVPWRKLPILFTLSYWKDVAGRHNVDAMHIEKNVFDNLLNTLLDIPGKAKDHINARRDLKVLDMMPELQLKEFEDGSYTVPRSKFWMTTEQKRLFCQVIKTAKLPYGYASNIGRCVKLEERRIVGYKSHDAHFMMQNLLPIAARVTLPEDVALPIIRLGAFFKSVYKKAINSSELGKLQKQIVTTLCEFERIFPPAFFDIMEHLTIHLVEEIELGGPVSSRCMYSVERYLRRQKANTGNKSKPEGSMAEAHIQQECVAYCARYMKKSCRTMVEDMADEEHDLLNGQQIGHPLKGKGRTSKKTRGVHRMDFATWSKAHRYVLFNCGSDEVDKYINEHETVTNNKRKRRWDVAQEHSKVFSVWFKERVATEIQEGKAVSDQVKWLSIGPSYVARRHSGYFIKGLRFHTRARDANLVTQNSGVTLTAETSSFSSSRDQNPVTGDVAYYGIIEDIIEIYYHGVSSGVVLFKCGWFHSEVDNCGIRCVNRNRSISKEDPFILASQARQVFYIADPRRLKKTSPLVPYEMERMETLRSNAAKMKDLGHGDLATAILEKQSATIQAKNAQIANSMLDKDLLSDDSDLDFNFEGFGQSVDDEDEQIPVKITSRKNIKVTTDSRRDPAKKTQNQQMENVNPPPGFGQKQQQCAPNGKKTTKQSKSQQRKSYVSPGSMGTYRLFRQKQQASQLNNDYAEQLANHQSREQDQTGQEDDPDEEFQNLHDKNGGFETGAEIPAEQLNTEQQNTEIPAEQQNTGQETVAKKKRTRGPTLLAHIHGRKLEDREAIFLNSDGQPVGPTDEAVAQFSRFLGTVARTQSLAPMNYPTWTDLPEGTFQTIWEYVNTCYLVPEAAMEHVELTVRDAWRINKSRKKNKHFVSYDNDAARLEKRPETMPEEDFQELLDFWNSPEVQAQSEKNKANRKALDEQHTLGCRSLAVLRHNLQQADPLKQPPTLLKVYKESRKRDPKRKYNTKYDKIQANLDKMSEIEAAQAEGGEGNQLKDPYLEVMKENEKKDRLRLYGRGVTERKLKKKKASSDPFVFPTVFVESMKSMIVKDVVSDLLAQIQAANPGMSFNVPNFQTGATEDASNHEQLRGDLNPRSSAATNVVQPEVEVESGENDHVNK